MKMVCFSDTHGQHRSKKLNKWFKDNPADILIFAGDYQLNSLDTGEDFIEWISGLPYKHKIITAGNHDNNSAITKKKSKKYSDINLLIHNSIEIEGIKFFASAYSRTFGHWSFMTDEDTLKYLYEKIPEDTEILITHTPPFKKLDLTFRGVDAGSTSLMNRIKQLPKLKYNIFGHIHESHNNIQRKNITYINCSIVNERYELINEPYIFEFEKE